MIFLINNNSVEDEIKKSLKDSTEIENIDLDILYRHKVLRTYILGKIWDENGEFILLQKLIKGSIKNDIIAKYPYVYDYEWEVVSSSSQYGKGDLILTDGKDNFKIIECKYIGHGNRANRRKKRRDLENQVEKYVDVFKEIHKEAKNVTGVGFTETEFNFEYP